MCGRSFVRSSSLISPSVRGRGILWLVSLFPLFSLPPPHLPPLIPSFPSLVIFALSASFSPILFHHSLASPSPSSLLPPFLFCLVHCLLHLPSSMPNPNAVSTPSKNQPPPHKKKRKKSPDSSITRRKTRHPNLRQPLHLPAPRRRPLRTHLVRQARAERGYFPAYVVLHRALFHCRGAYGYGPPYEARCRQDGDGGAQGEYYDGYAGAAGEDL